MATRKKYTVITFKINSTVNPHLFVVHTMKEKNWESKVITDLPDGSILITVVVSQVEAPAQIKPVEKKQVLTSSDVSNIESAKNQEITFCYVNNYNGDIILYWKKEQSIAVLDCFKANKIRPKLKDVTASFYSAKISKLAFEKLSQKYLLKDIRDKR